MTFWNGVFKLGIFGFVVTVLFGLLTVATYAIGINEGPIAEGGTVSRYARLIGFWLFLT